MLKQLTAHDFRNLHDPTWAPGPGSHLIFGSNGAGKTSLLEAVYVLATTRSFRTSQVGDCARRAGLDSDGDTESAGRSFALRGEAEGLERVRLEVGWAEGRVWRTVNGRQTTLAEHFGQLPVVAWTAGAAAVLVGAPEHQRRLLDRGVVATRPGALASLARYRRALRQKRELLWRGQAGLESWNEVLAEAGAEVIAGRGAYVEALGAALDEARQASGLPYPRIALVYRPSPAVGREGSGAIARALAKAGAEERTRGQTLLGPHRDRLEILWGGVPVRRVASAGEAKALGLLLAAAQAGVLVSAGRDPVLLLDDADAELDGPTLGAVWQVVGRGGQVVASSSRPEAWERREIGARWELRGGVLQPFG